MPKSEGEGLAAGAGRTIKLRQEYNTYRTEAAMGGAPVLSFEEWLSRVKGVSPPTNAPSTNPNL